MAREVATSREVATRESADRMDGLYIVENDWMVWQKAFNNQLYIHDIYTYLQYPNSFTLQFLYQFSDAYKLSTCIASCVNWPASDGKYKGLWMEPVVISLSSDLVAGKKIIMSYNNINKRSDKQLITFVFNGINSDVLQNNISIKTGITDTCEDFSLSVVDFNFAMPGIFSPISQSVSHFQVWNKVISTSEIEYCYNRLFSGQSLLGTEDGLACYFPCQEGSGNLITDIVGGKTGTLSGAEWRQYGGLREVA